MSKFTTAIEASTLDSRESILEATANVKAEKSRLDTANDKAMGNLMTLASRVVFAAFESGIVSKTAGQNDDYAAGPVSARAYSRDLGLSQTYVLRLFRLGNGIASGAIVAGSTEASKVQSYGNAAEYAVLDSPDVTTESVLKAEAERLQKARDKAKADKATKAREAEERTAREAEAEAAADRTEYDEAIALLAALRPLIRSAEGAEAETLRQALVDLASQVGESAPHAA